MSSAAMKVVFDNLTSGAGRRAEQDYDTGSAAHLEADATEVNMRSARVSTQMRVTDWAKAQRKDPRQPWIGVTSTRRNLSLGSDSSRS